MKKTPELLEKKSVLRSLKELPDRFSADDVMERVMLLEAIAEGLADIKAGRVVPIAEAKKKHRQWLK
ncbi:MAG: hypothetical protein IPM12_02395 [Flavobacteriales bacterium]|nr:hypothetical protein [Flavobacteriales bacterium]